MNREGREGHGAGCFLRRGKREARGVQVRGGHNLLIFRAVPRKPSSRETGAGSNKPVDQELTTPPEATNTGPGLNRGSVGRRPGVWLRRTGRGICGYREGSFPIAHDASLCACLCICRHYASEIAVGRFKSKSSTHFHAQFSNTPNTRMPPPRCPWATRPIHARCPKRFP